MSIIGKWFGFGRDENYDEGIRCFDRGGYENAIVAFEACLNDPSDPSTARLAHFYIGESHAQLGHAALHSENYPEAVRRFESALELHPNYPDLHYQLARACGKVGDREGESRELDTALRLNPQYAEAVLYQGVLWYSEGRFDEGLERIGQAVAIEPLFNQERYRFALRCHEVGDTARALANLPALMEGAPCDANFHAQFADSLVKDGRFDEAIEEYSKALDLAPSYADVHCRYGQALFETGSVEKAAEEFRRAIEINENYVEAHAQLGIALRRLGQENEARAEFKCAVGLDPYHLVASQELARR
jgi:tetratricopeptide (TPR) repeat protein